MEGHHWFLLTLFVYFIDISASINQLQLQPNSPSNATRRIRIQIKPYRPHFPQTTIRSTLIVNNNLNDRNSYTTQQPTTLKSFFNARISTRSYFPFKPASDPLEISSSDDNLSWSQRKRYQSRWYRPPVPTSTTNRPLEKLRKPKPTRPAMYSLNGYVPKPSLKFKPTTEAPNDVLAWKVIDLQALGSVTRRNKVKFLNDAVTPEDSSRRYGNRPKTVAPSYAQDNKRKVAPARYRTSRRNGIAGLDFPAFESIPVTSFDCGDKLIAGMYADVETQCQVWHLCPGGNSQFRHSFLCANGTVFSEKKGVCDWWYNVDC